MGSRSKRIDQISSRTLQKLSFKCRDFIVIKSIEQMHEQYEIKDKIGNGTYGQVFKAGERKTGMLRAVKQIKMN